MSELVIHGVAGSPYVRAAQIAAEEKGAPWRLEPLQEGGSRGEAHLKRHPFGRIPAVEHDGFALYETQAIVRYIDQAFPGPALQPADPRAAKLPGHPAASDVPQGGLRRPPLSGRRTWA